MRSFFACFLLCSISLMSVSCAGLSLQSRPFFENTFYFAPSSSRQVIEVTTSCKSAFKARLTVWAYDHGRWHRAFGPWPAVIGRHGFAYINKKREGDGMTPSGVYPVGPAFGKEAKLNTGLLYRQAKEDDVWIDDVNSSQYNTWAKTPALGVSSEKMLRPDGLYDVGAVIGYNIAPVVHNNGSAIFIHIWRDGGGRPTGGCVTLDQKRLRRLLAWLKADMKPVIALGVQRQ